MVTHSSILAWRIPWSEERGGLQSMGLRSRTWLSDWFLPPLPICFTDYFLKFSCCGTIGCWSPSSLVLDAGVQLVTSCIVQCLSQDPNSTLKRVSQAKSVTTESRYSSGEPALGGSPTSFRLQAQGEGALQSPGSCSCGWSRGCRREAVTFGRKTWRPAGELGKEIPWFYSPLGLCSPAGAPCCLAPEDKGARDKRPCGSAFLGTEQSGEG